MIFGGMRRHALNMAWSMKLFKRLVKAYFVFGLGVIFGAIVSTIVTYGIMSFACGDIDTIKILQIQECLKEKIND